jgi:hypothetical protein
VTTIISVLGNSIHVSSETFDEFYKSPGPRFFFKILQTLNSSSKKWTTLKTETEGLLTCSQEPYPETVHKLTHYSISSWWILIRSSYLRLHHPSGLFSSGFPTKILYAFLISHARNMPRPPHPLWLDHPNNICWRVILHVMKLIIMQFPPASGFLERPVLKHHRCMLFPYSEATSSTPIKYTRYNYSFV